MATEAIVGFIVAPTATTLSASSPKTLPYLSNGTRSAGGTSGAVGTVRASKSRALVAVGGVSRRRRRNTSRSLARELTCHREVRRWTEVEMSPQQDASHNVVPRYPIRTAVATSQTDPMSPARGHADAPIGARHRRRSTGSSAPLLCVRERHVSDAPRRLERRGIGRANSDIASRAFECARNGITHRIPRPGLGHAIIPGWRVSDVASCAARARGNKHIDDAPKVVGPSAIGGGLSGTTRAALSPLTRVTYLNDLGCQRSRR